MLVSSSIYQACKFYELFDQTDLKDKCAIITSYKPSPGDIKGEETGEGLTEKLRQYDIYRKMLAEWFNEPPEAAANRVEEFKIGVKKKFISEPGQMKLLIVVDKLLTGFDAPSATYLYIIDRQMRDSGIPQFLLSTWLLGKRQRDSFPAKAWLPHRVGLQLEKQPPHFETPGIQLIIRDPIVYDRFDFYPFFTPSYAKKVKFSTNL